jgi:hypothetical protein
MKKYLIFFVMLLPLIAKAAWIKSVQGNIPAHPLKTIREIIEND